MKAKNLTMEMRVEAGVGEDHDIGTVDGWNEITGLATVRWDSGVVTPCPIRNLRARPDDEQPTIERVK